MTKYLFISCVNSGDRHPSQQLLKYWQKEGGDSLVLFKNSRSLVCFIDSIWELWLKCSQFKNYQCITNVNGSHHRLAINLICWFKAMRCNHIIMDIYPGCLPYVTKFWRLFYVPFLLCEWIDKKLSNNIIVIDESFVKYYPQHLSTNRIFYIPIFWRKFYKENKKRSKIVICGNIEWQILKENLSTYIDIAKGLNLTLCLATSEYPEFLSNNDVIELVVPWTDDDTEKIWTESKFMIVPLSTHRLKYSSPSKIIDGLINGLTIIIDCDYKDWILERHRNIYKHCFHISEKDSWKKWDPTKCNESIYKSQITHEHLKNIVEKSMNSNEA